jgi:small basic protein
VIASESVAPKQETNMSKKLKLAVLAAVLAIFGAISSPVLAAGYDDPAFTGGGSTGYNAHIGDS